MKIVTEEIYFSNLGEKRRIDYYTPNSKVEGIIYFHDGQNMLKDEYSSLGRSWRLEEFIDNNPKYDKYAVVCIWHGTKRFEEYTIWDFSLKALDKNYNNNTETFPIGELYMKDIIDNVIPYIDDKVKYYGNNRVLCGSSMGGLISLAIALSYPNVFRNIAAISNAIWATNTDEFFYDMENKPFYINKIFMSCGTNEAHGDITDYDYSCNNDRLFEILKNKNVNCDYRKIEGGKHNEEYWEK